MIAQIANCFLTGSYENMFWRGYYSAALNIHDDIRRRGTKEDCHQDVLNLIKFGTEDAFGIGMVLARLDALGL